MQEKFTEVSSGEQQLWLPTHVTDPSVKAGMASYEFTPSHQEMNAQKVVIGAPEAYGAGSIRNENLQEVAEQAAMGAALEKQDRSVEDMLKAENILDLKASFDHVLGRMSDESHLTVDRRLDKDGSRAASKNELAAQLKEQMIDAYTQVGVRDGEKRDVPDKVRDDIARLMEMSYEELEAKAEKPARNSDDETRRTGVNNELPRRDSKERKVEQSIVSAEEPESDVVELSLTDDEVAALSRFKATQLARHSEGLQRPKPNKKPAIQDETGIGKFIELPGRKAKVDVDRDKEPVAEPIVVELPGDDKKSEPVVVELTQAEIDDTDVASVVPIALGPATVEAEPRTGSSSATVVEIKDAIAKNKAKRVTDGDEGVAVDAIPDGSFDDTLVVEVDDEGDEEADSTPITVVVDPPAIVTREDLGMDADGVAPEPVKSTASRVAAAQSGSGGSLYRRLHVAPTVAAPEVTGDVDPRVAKVKETEQLKKLRTQLETSRDELATFMTSRKGRALGSRKFSEKNFSKAMARHDLYLDRVVSEGVKILGEAGYEGDELTSLVNWFKAVEARELTMKEMELTLATASPEKKTFLQEWSDDEVSRGKQRMFFAKRGGLFAVMAGVATEIFTKPDLLDQFDNPKVTALTAVAGLMTGLNRAANDVVSGAQTVEAPFKVRDARGDIKTSREVREVRANAAKRLKIDTAVTEADRRGQVVENREINRILRERLNAQRKVGRAEARKPLRRKATRKSATSTAPKLVSITN